MITTAGSRRSAAYIRVSTEEQNLGLQENLVKSQNPEITYSDKESGSVVERLAYTKLCREIEKGNVSEVMVYRLDRLGRDPVELIRFFDLLDLHQVKFRSLTEPWLSDWNMGPMQLLKDRQKRGIAAARLRGKHLGRPKKKVPL
jgi:DNA invertase Pin-like site-specific DNA recombinase